MRENKEQLKQEIKKEVKEELKEELKKGGKEEKERKWFYPTNKTPVFFEIIFILALLISLLNFPLTSFMSGTKDVKMEFGWPFHFFTLELDGNSAFPISFSGMILDLIIYVGVSYALDISITYLFKKRKE